MTIYKDHFKAPLSCLTLFLHYFLPQVLTFLIFWVFYPKIIIVIDLCTDGRSFFLVYRTHILSFNICYFYQKISFNSLKGFFCVPAQIVHRKLVKSQLSQDWACGYLLNLSLFHFPLTLHLMPFISPRFYPYLKQDSFN